MRAAVVFLIVIVFAQADVLHEGYGRSIEEYRRRQRYETCLKICVNKSKRVKFNEILCSECSQLRDSYDFY